jgi:hypothetical protein
VKKKKGKEERKRGKRKREKLKNIWNEKARKQ